jgi:hypothetical protein
MENLEEWVKLAVAGEEAEIDVVAEAAAMFAEHGVPTQRHGHDLYVEKLGLVLSPRGLSVADAGNGGVRTVTVVHATHPTVFPDSLFEFQHAVGDDAREALRSGFSQWARIDLTVLCDAVRDTPETCSMMEMTFPSTEEGAELERRLILGPIAQMAQHPAGEDEDEHPFCPCCLTTNCFQAFEPLFKATDTLGVRLFAMRDADGQTSADCRVNGHEFEPGAAALRAYAESWPGRGFEFRKQYVLYQTR